MSRWFRFYDGVVDDPKVQRLPASLFRFWVNILCLSSRNGGELPSVVDIAFSLRTTEKSVTSNILLLVEAGLVDQLDGVSTPHNWNARQFKADVSTERVKRFRERSMKRDETVSRNAPETEQNRAETEQKESKSPQAAQDTPAKPRSKALAKIESDTFAAFYAEYPLKKARPAAAKAYAAALSRASPDALLAGACRYAAARATQDPKFTKHPATWLNQDCWLDEEPANDHRAQVRTPHGNLIAGAQLFIDSLGGDDDGRGQEEIGADAHPAQLAFLAP